MNNPDKYSMTLVVKDLSDGGVNIALTCDKLSNETLTPEERIDLNEADKRGLRDKPGAPAIMYQIMEYLNGVKEKIGK